MSKQRLGEVFFPWVNQFVGDRTGSGLNFPDLLSGVCFLRQENYSAGLWIDLHGYA